MEHDFVNMPHLPGLSKDGIFPPAPDAEACAALWQKYDMLPNVRRHSLLVAHIAASLAQRARQLGLPVDVDAVRASGMLHDIAKTYCLRHGGSHSLLGGAWTVYETRHYGIAQGVILHVHWPWPLPHGKDICILPIFVLYADKRVRHDACVPLAERFSDLLDRYGKSEAARKGIKESFEQAKNIESRLERQLEMKLDENTFDCGRLVEREGSFAEWGKEH